MSNEILSKASKCVDANISKAANQIAFLSKKNEWNKGIKC